MTKDMKQAKIDEGTLVAIRSRRCADTVQPNVRRGMVLQVRKVSTLRSGGTRLECVEHEATAPGRPRRVTVNSDRFEWPVVSERMVEEAARRGRTAYEQLRAERREVEQARLDRAMADGLHRDAAKKTAWLMSHLTFAEQALISIIPHIVAEAAWLAAERARQWAVDHRVGALVKVNRAIKHLREEHDRRLTIYLDAPHRADLTTRARSLLDDDIGAQRLTVWGLALGNEYFAQYPGADDPYRELRILATLAMVWIDAYRRVVDRGNELVTDRSRGRLKPNLGNELVTDRLRAQMDAMRGDYVLHDSHQLLTIGRAVDNAVKGIRIEEGELDGLSR